VGVVFVVVQPENHGGAFGNFDKQVSEFAQAFFSEHVHHVDDLVIVVDFGHSGRE
jgi:hypothetical protein